MKKVLCFVLSLMIFLHSLALDVSYAADFAIVPIIANYSVSDLNKNFANIDNDVFYYAVGGTVTAYAATRGYQLVKDKFSDTKQAFVDIGRKMYDTVLEMPGNTKGAFINLLGSLARFTRNTTNLTAWLADQIPVLWNAGKDVMQNIFNIFHSNEAFNDWQSFPTEIFQQFSYRAPSWRASSFASAFDNFVSGIGELWFTPPVESRTDYFRVAIVDKAFLSRFVLVIDDPGTGVYRTCHVYDIVSSSYVNFAVFSSSFGYSVGQIIYRNDLSVGDDFEQSSSFAVGVYDYGTNPVPFDNLADFVANIANFNFFGVQFYSTIYRTKSSFDFPIYVGKYADPSTWVLYDLSSTFGFETVDSDIITVAPADSVLDIKDFALDIEQAVPVAGVIADTVSLYTDNVYENEQSVAADIPVSVTGTYESSIPTIELPTGQIIVPGGLFGKVNHYIKYLWEMTKPLVTYMSQILTALTWHDGGGPAWLFYGAIVVSIIGGMVYKFLQ